MRRARGALLAASAVVVLASCGEGNSADDQAEVAPPQSAENPDAGTETSVAADMVLRSSAFDDGGAIPVAQVCEAQGGQDLSPELAWEQVPTDTTSLALVVDDPDAPVEGGFVHWVVVDLSAADGGVLEGAEVGTQGVNGLGETGWFGPCPPPGDPHTYVFTLYAFAEAPQWPEQPTREDVLGAADDAIATAELTGTFGNAG